MSNHIDVTQIPAVDVRNLCATCLAAIEEYYQNPENQKRFEEWKKEKEKAK